MKYLFIAIAAIQGLFGVGALALLEVIVQAFRPEWHLPFSVWWGLLMGAPATVMGLLVFSNE